MDGKISLKSTPSLHSTTSSVTLVPEPDEYQYHQTQPPARYLYHTQRDPLNHFAQSKPLSKLSKFMSKFQSRRVRDSVAAHKRSKLEEDRTRREPYPPLGMPQSVKAWHFGWGTY